jgi:SecD/SecF fusion protein
MFSAMVIAELAIHTWLSKGKEVGFNTKYSKGLFQNFNFDWMGKRKYFYAFSIVVTIAGIISLSTRGLKQSVEFTGGRTFAVKFEKKADIESIRKELTKVFVEIVLKRENIVEAFKIVVDNKFVLNFKDQEPVFKDSILSNYFVENLIQI